MGLKKHKNQEIPRQYTEKEANKLKGILAEK